MQIHVYDHAQQVGQAAATLLAAQLISKPNSVLGLATGSTPIPTYQALISLYKAGVVDFSSASSFNLDEYVGLPAGHPCSYHSFMREQLFDHVNMPADHIHIPDGNAADPQTECARDDQAITAAGGIDMQVLGIGRNGHIGFNEPDDHFTCGCHVVNLTESTIQANRRFFDSEASVPRQAVSLGVGSILASRCRDAVKHIKKSVSAVSGRDAFSFFSQISYTNCTLGSSRSSVAFRYTGSRFWSAGMI